MPFASQLQVDNALRPFFGEMVATLSKAHSDWAESKFASSMQHPTVRANVIWNQFIAHAKALCEGRSDIRVDGMGHCQGLMIGTSFFVRMKKGDGQLLSSNVPTQAALDFNDASVDLFEGVIRLELLYTLDSLGASIARIAIAQRHRNKILWKIDLLDEDHGQGAIAMPQQPLPDTSVAKRLITPKKIVEKIKKNASSGNAE